ncbi:MAG TPA: hypothetical protein VL309_09110 [Vicinamibacterales bacterium]|jgi:hypothetical protein|nr:hypothetical protein [Vicinamibacterales bacterium]
MRHGIAAAAAAAALAFTAPAWAQGKSQEHKKGGPPSKSRLPPPAGVGGAVSATTPFGWLDDASVLDPGSATVGISVVQWNGSGISETNLPVVDAGLGLAPRVQLTANVPRVLAGSDPAIASGLGTSFFGVKVGVFDDRSHGIKAAVSPMVEIFGSAAVAALDPGASRVQWGVPASIEIDRGATRAYAGAGYFSSGVWFMGAGGSVQPGPRTAVSVAVTRSWTGSAIPDVPLSDRDRNEISGGVFYAFTPAIGVFGAAGHTVATSDANGAGAVFAAGMSFRK